METPNENSPAVKERHGCVTAWLILIIIANSILGFVYLFTTDQVLSTLPIGSSETLLMIMGILGLGNIVFAILLFQWKKSGFWGYVATSIVALVINLMIGIGIGQSLLGLAGIAILYGVLQIKNNNVTAWEHLE